MKFLPLIFALALSAVARGPAKQGAQCPFAWNPSSDANALGYNIYFGTNSRAYQWVEYVSATNTLAVVTNMWFNTTNYVACTTLDADGAESDFSNEVMFYTNSATPPKSFWRW